MTILENEATTTIDRRARRVGLSMAAIARESHVKYHRILQGADLLPDEAWRIENVLAREERRQNRYRSAATV